MTMQLTIYTENKRGIDPNYEVTERLVRQALRRIAQTFLVTVRTADDPDLSALRAAHFFIGSGFDVERLRKYGTCLRLVHCTSAGVEGYLPLDWLPANAVLTNSSGVHAEKGGAFGAMAVLMLNERMPRHITNQRRHIWDSTLSTAIAGKNVLIYGFGSLGEAIATRLKPFGIRIIGVRRSGEFHPLADEMFAPDQLRLLLPRTDFLVLSCPLTNETRGLIGKVELALLPAGAGVFNIARAGVLDNSALAAALTSGALSGAIVDVFDPEPLPQDSPWWDVPNLVVSPHVSCDESKDYIERCLAIFADNVERLMDGRPLVNVVDSLRGY
jgi:glyoxylate/hydroxypyruvate reductase A